MPVVWHQQGKVGVSDTSPPLTRRCTSAVVTDAEFRGHLAGWRRPPFLCAKWSAKPLTKMSDHDTMMHSKFLFHPLALRQTYDKQILATWISLMYNLTKISTFRDREYNRVFFVRSEAGERMFTRSLKFRSDSPVRRNSRDHVQWQHEIVTVVSSRKNGAVFPQPQYLWPDFSGGFC